MIVELNKLYILSAPSNSQGMTPDESNFIESTSSNVTYSHMNKMEVATEEKPVTSIAKVFEHQGQTLQAIMFITNYPINKAKKTLNNTVLKYAKNVAEIKKGK